MEKNLENLLARVKGKTHVFEGENPLTNTNDALTVATRAGVVYRWAKNGPYYEVRRTPAHSVEFIPAASINQWLMMLIVDDLPEPEATPTITDVPDEDPLEELFVEGADTAEIGVWTPAALDVMEENDLMDEGILWQVEGTGKDGKVTKKDALTFVANLEEGD